MKPLFNIVFMVTVVTASAAFAAHGSNHSPDATTTTPSDVKKLDCTNVVQVSVNGLVCDFCARALEKVFSKREEVDHIRVNLTEGKVTVAMKPGVSMDDETVKELITNSGYDVSNISKGCG